MRKIIFLAFLLIAACANEAASKLPEDYHKELIELSNHKTGNYILKMLELQLGTSGSVEKLKALLIGIKTSWLKTQEMDDRISGVVLSSCQSLEAQLKGQIPLYEKVVKQSAEKQTTLEAEIKTLSKDESNANAHLSNILERREKQSQIQKQQKAQHEAKVNQIQGAIASINSAVEILNTQASNSRTLAQLDSKLSAIFQVSSGLALIQTQSLTDSLIGERKELSEEGQTEETAEDRREKLVGLLNQLGDLFRFQSQKENEQYSTDNVNVLKLIGDLDIQIKSIRDRADHFRRRRQKAERERDEASARVAENKEFLGVSQKELVAIQADCKVQENNFARTKESRSTDINIIDNLIRYLGEHSNALKEYLYSHEKK